MNKFIRAMLITFAICLVIGGGVVIAGVALGGTLGDATVSIGDGESDWPVRSMFDHGIFKFRSNTEIVTSEPDSSDYIGELTVPANEIRDLEIVLRNCELKIEKSYNDQISVSVVENDKKYCAVRQNGDKLEIIDTRKKVNTARLKTLHVVMCVPEQHLFDEVDLDLGAGDIKIDRLAAKNIDIDGGAGSLDAEVLIAKNQLDADLGVGDFYINEATLGQTDIDCGVGSFEVVHCELTGDADINGGVGDVMIGIVGEKEDFNYELSCGMGELEVFDESYTSLGKDKEIDNGARYTISLECGVGRMSVYRKDGNRNNEVLDHHEEHYDEEPDHYEKHFD